MLNIDHLDFFGNEKFDEIIDKLFSNAGKIERLSENGIPFVRVYAPRKRENIRNTLDKMRNKPTSTNIPSWRKEIRPNGEVQKPMKPVDFPNEKKVGEEERGRNVDFSKRPVVDSKPSIPVDIPSAIPPKCEPKSLMEMLEDGDERLEKILGKIIDKKLAERNIAVDNSADVDDEEDEEQKKDEPPKKNASVFIANRLTFLIQALQPLVFDTSLIETSKNSMTIAINESKTHPRIVSLDDLGFITSRVNASSMVTQEIENYLVDTEFSNIYCFPATIENKDGENVFAVRFVVYPRYRYSNF